MDFTKKIGQKTINPIGIGTWLMGGGVYPESKTTFAVYGQEQREIDAIRFSIEQGQNHIDTAQMYGAGHTEEVVGQALEGLDRDSLFVASKVWKSHATTAALPHAISGMLNRLKLKQLDLVYAHAPFPELPMKEYIDGLNDAVDQGLTVHIGVSNFSLDQLRQAVGLSRHPIAAIQNHYNLLHKREFSDDLQTFCRENNIMMVAYRPLGRKMLADECHNETILAMAQKYNKTPAQIALNWLISQKNMVCIPKTSTKANITENIAALRFEMTQEDIDLLKNLPDEAQK